MCCAWVSHHAVIAGPEVAAAAVEAVPPAARVPAVLLLASAHPYDARSQASMFLLIVSFH
ncbi:unnamed protein product [Fusarium graminearum]|nr:unnamed protein product [Fusarium graminearum]